MKVFRFILVGIGLCMAFAKAEAAEPLKVQGVPVLTGVLTSAIPQLQKQGIPVNIGEGCGSAQAMTALGKGDIDLALLARPITVEERATYPDRDFQQFKLATQAVAIMVSRSVWESGVHAIKLDQAIELYEGRIKNWKQLGGEDRLVKFYDNEPGLGVWEIFVTWLYSETRKAPAVSWETVKTGKEAYEAVEFNSGAAAVAALRWADRRDVFPLAIIDATGATIEPTPDNLTNGKYPLTRSVYVVVGGRPATNKRKLIEFLQGPEGQALTKANDLLPPTDTPEAGSPVTKP